MYFKLNQLRQCKFLIAAVENAAFPALEPPPPGKGLGGIANPTPSSASGYGASYGAIDKGYYGFPMSQLVTYKYYTGLLALYDEQYGRANACLSYALEHCHADYEGNKRRILEALVPVRLLLGQLPSQKLLDRHGLQRYSGILEGVKTGNVTAFAHAMSAHREAFIASGVYLLLERLQLYTYRTLFRRIVRLAGSTKINLSMLQAGLAAAAAAPVNLASSNGGANSSSGSSSSGISSGSGIAAASMDIAEVECVVANLIYGKFIRGYLSHKPPVLVVAKSDAFRPLSEVAASSQEGQ